MHRLAALAALLVIVSPSGQAQVGEPAFIVDVPSTEKSVEPQRVVFFEVTLTSRADEPMRIWFERVSQVGRGQTITPNAVLLAPGGSPEGRLTVSIGMQSPYENGRIDETTRVTYQITPRDPETNATLGDRQEVTFTMRTIGTYVPAPQFFGVFLALAVAALLLRPRASR